MDESVTFSLALLFCLSWMFAFVPARNELRDPLKTASTPVRFLRPQGASPGFEAQSLKLVDQTVDPGEGPGGGCDNQAF